MRYARSGALVRIVSQDDACDVCQARSERIYTPSDVPRLPIRGCMNGVCRCAFVAVDPQTELTVPQLVERGITALRAGRAEIAREALRKAVTLDEMYEFGWLWLGAVVDDLEKVRCLEKVIEINPRNQRARAGLISLRRKLAQTRPLILANLSATSDGVPGAESGVERIAAREEEPPPVPDEVLDIRAERQVIVEQWSDFIQIAIETDPHMLTMQGDAFLTKIVRLDDQALSLLTAPLYLAELQAQWADMEDMGASLLKVIETHHKRQDGTRSWQAMNDALRNLAQELSEHGKALRAKIAQMGGRITRK
jgi:hypothetical protein